MERKKRRSEFAGKPIDQSWQQGAEIRHIADIVAAFPQKMCGT